MKESAGQDSVLDPHGTAAGRLKFPKILIPTDSRETAQFMVPLAKKLLAPGGNIVTLNVIDTTFPLEVIDKWKGWQRWQGRYGVCSMRRARE